MALIIILMTQNEINKFFEFKIFNIMKTKFISHNIIKMGFMYDFAYFLNIRFCNISASNNKIL